MITLVFDGRAGQHIRSENRTHALVLAVAKEDMERVSLVLEVMLGSGDT